MAIGSATAASATFRSFCPRNFPSKQRICRGCLGPGTRAPLPSPVRDWLGAVLAAYVRPMAGRFFTGAILLALAPLFIGGSMLSALAVRADDAAAGLAPLTPIVLKTTARPTVVELFTSQGCSSCVPADQYMGELVKRPSLLPLTYHVDYWDYIGWRDPFAAPDFTLRQRAYAEALRHRMIYTPQMVIAGAIDAVGADRLRVEQALTAAPGRAPMYPLSVGRDATGRLMLDLPEVPLAIPATIWLLTYGAADETDVGAGENVGRRLMSFNTVRALRKIGLWSGRAQRLLLTLPSNADGAGADGPKPTGCAIIANLAENGPIVAAAAFDFSEAW